MFEKLRYKSKIRLFLYVVLGIFIVLVLLRVILTQNWLPTDKHVISPAAHYLLDLIDKFIVSLVITVGVGACIHYLTKDDPDHDVQILDPEDIGGMLKKAMKNTDKWYFNGASGSYTRTQTLPFLAKLAGKKNITIPINILLMNPLNEELCTKYAEYRNSLDIETSFKNKNLKSVQKDILATILSCYVWRKEQPRLTFKIGLKDYFAILRTDLSAENAIITKENPNEIALMFKKNGVFYNAQLEEFNHALNQVHLLPSNSSFKKFDEVDAKSVKAFLIELNLMPDFTDDDINELITQIKSRKNPYGG